MNRRLLIAVASGTLLNPLNSSMIAVALSRIQRDFGLSFATASWLIAAFYLASAVGHPLTGRLGDRVGARRAFLGGLALMAAASALAPLAPSFGTLVGARVLQALGTSTLFPAAMLVVGTLAEGRDEALALIRVISTGAAAVGPALGGLLLWLGDWWLIFAINLPVVALSAALALPLLPDARDDPAPVAHSGAFANRPLVVTYVQFALVNVVFYCVMFGVPSYLEQGTGLPAQATGFAMLALPLCGIVGTTWGVRWVRRLGLQPTLAGAALVLGAGLTLLGLASAGHGVGAVIGALALIGLANGVHNMGLQAALHATAPREALGAASGVFMAARYVGAIGASAVLGMLFGATIGAAELRALTLAAGAFALGILACTALLRTA